MLRGRRALVSAAASVAFPASPALVGLLLGACTSVPRPSPIPMDVVFDDAACSRTLAPVLLVLLPGAYMTIAELQREGFIAAVRRRGLAVDVAIADSNLGYVQDGSVMERLRDELIERARARGYQRIWMAGISLGGNLALHYARLHPGEIEGLFVIAPYLGRRPLLDDIAASGGAARWRGGARPRDADDVDHALWQWLTDPATRRPPLFLGFGSSDRLAQGHRLLAGLLSSDHVDEVPGGHDWPPWRQLWATWLDRGLMPRDCSG